jgi:hypothetical protein
MWTGYLGVRIESSGGTFWRINETSGSIKSDERLRASFCSTILVSWSQNTELCSVDLYELDFWQSWLEIFGFSCVSPDELTLWITVFLWKLITAKLAKKFLSPYVTRRFITVFTTACHWTLSWARCIQPTSSRSVSLNSIIIWFLPTDFLTKLLYKFIVSLTRAILPSISSLLSWSR